MANVPRISELEWQVMKVVWARSPIQASEIIETLQADDPKWHHKTVKTLVNRLMKKRALGFKKDGRAYLYSPRVREEDCVRVASESFLERVFNGALAPLVAH